MNLIIDIGNNSAKFFLFNGEQILLHTRRNDASYEVISEWNRQFGIDKAIVSTVIDLTEQQKAEFKSLGCHVIWFDNTTSTPLKIEYSTPHTLGSDRIAAAVGAWNEQPCNNMLVIDAGSAITIDFVTRQGVYKGGNIAPGVKMRLKALHEYTGRLPLVEKEGETPAFGHDTETAIRSGAYINQGYNYAIFTTQSQVAPEDAYVDNKRYYEDDVWVIAGTTPRYAKFLLSKDPAFFLPNGIYYIKNKQYNRYIQLETLDSFYYL